MSNENKDSTTTLTDLQNIDNRYERQTRRRIINNFVDAGEVPDRERETRIHFDEGWITTTESEVASHLLRIPQFRPFLVIVDERQLQPESYCGGPVHRIYGNTSSHSVSVDQILSDILYSLSNKNAHRFAFTPEQPSTVKQDE